MRVEQMLNKEKDIQVASKISGYKDVLPETRRLLPDAVILLTDEKNTSRSVINTARNITNEELPVRVLIMSENVARDVVPAIKAGAAGLLSQSVDRSELLSALRAPAHSINIEPEQEITPKGGFKEVQ